MADAISPLAGPAAGGAPATGAAAQRDAELRQSAKAFEAVFVAQMLSQSGLGEAIAADGGFGGEAFSGFLIEQYADQLTEKGGFGLAERIYEQLRQQDGTRAD